MFKRTVFMCVFCVAGTCAINFDAHFSENRALIERALCIWEARHDLGITSEYRGNIVYNAILEQFGDDVANWFSIGCAESECGHIMAKNVQAAAHFLLAECLAGAPASAGRNPVLDIMVAIDHVRKNPVDREMRAVEISHALRRVPSFLNTIMRPHLGALVSSVFVRRAIPAICG